jgi:hypothetical protein
VLPLQDVVVGSVAAITEFSVAQGGEYTEGIT